MKKAKYLIEIPYENGFVLYNTLYGSVIKLNEDYYEIFKRIANGESKGLEEETEVFLKQKMLYTDIESEENDIDEFESRQGDVLQLTILTTTACNMQCVYCFERLVPINADKELAYNILTFVERVIAKKKFSRLRVTWFGGEPLVNKALIFELSSKLISLCEKNGVVYSSDIITNGTLLTKETAEDLKNKCRVSWCQITIDGLAEKHNKRRPFGGKDGFSLILNNVEQCCDCIDIAVRVNVDRDNENELEKIVKYLSENEKIRKNIFLHVARVKGEKPVCMSTDEFGKINRRFINILKRNNFEKSVSGFSLSGGLLSCGMNNDKSYVIYPNGDLYRCLETVGRKEYSIGNIRDYKFESEPVTKIAINSKCVSCNKYPYCMKNYCSFSQKAMSSDNCVERTEQQIRDLVYAIME
ncbi:MAG: radical SAM protein [Lachnospiraceae bacterium]|nr:radical SAM protein [Lachnospiraceae bacterium]